MIEVRYFARLRERLGTGAEQIEATPELADLGTLTVHLSRRGGVWAEALGADQTLMTAVNQELAGPHTPIQDGDEVAYFPPVTGG
jgi:molybdopterin synthase sulfur carrier subunit